MYNFNSAEHQQRSDIPANLVQGAIDNAHDKAYIGQFVMYVTHAGDVPELPEFAASVREDIAEIVHDTDNGYSVFSN